MAVQPFQLPLDSLFSSLTEPSSPAVATPARTRRGSGVSRTVIAIAATSVFFGGAGSLYMHASMGHMAMTDGRMATTTSGTPGDSMPLTAAMPAPAAMAGTGADAAPPRPLSDGMPMPAAAAAAPAAAAPTAANPMDASADSSPMASGPKPSTTTASSRISSSEAASSKPATTSSTSSSASSTVRRVTVGDGDSFSTLAARYHVSEARIAALNPGVDSSDLTIGQTLRVR